VATAPDGLRRFFFPLRRRRRLLPEALYRDVAALAIGDCIGAHLGGTLAGVVTSPT
jgi:hypothetical protein